MLRQCRPEEVHLLRDAVDTSLDHLRAWMPWAMNEPRSIDATRAHIEKNLESFDRSEDFSYNLFEPDERLIVGGIGLHRRSEPGCLEIGYWLRASRVGRGYATEATQALTRAALNLPWVSRIQIDCDPHNRASARVAEKAGYVLLERRSADKLTPEGLPRDTLVFEIQDVGRIP